MTSPLTFYIVAYFAQLLPLVIVAAGAGWLAYDAGRTRGASDARQAQLTAMAAATLHEATAAATAARATLDRPCPGCGGHNDV